MNAKWIHINAVTSVLHHAHAVTVNYCNYYIHQYKKTTDLIMNNIAI